MPTRTAGARAPEATPSTGLMTRIRQRLAGRPDSEHEQSIVRIVIVTLLVVYYEEGSGSAVRVRRFRLGKDGLESLPWD